MSFSGGFPGMPGQMPGAVPHQQAAAPGGGFMLQIPPDPNWTPIEQTDNLAKDGYYMAKIIKEEASTQSDKTPGVFFYFEIQDADERGRKLSKKMPDSTQTKGNTWFLWRGLMMSIYGTLDVARNGFNYQPPMFVGATVYIKTESFMDDGQMRTGVGPYVTAKEYGEAVQAGKHRWDAKPRQANAGAGPVGALPGGVPSFPGLGVGLPGAPTVPGVAPPQMVAPAPMAAAPMQQPPQMAAPPTFQQPQAPQQMQMPQQPMAPPPPPFIPGQMPPPGAVAPWQPAGQPTAPPVNGAPQPTGAPPFAFPVPGKPA